jgi:hypothetical protein
MHLLEEHDGGTWAGERALITWIGERPLIIGFIRNVSKRFENASWLNARERRECRAKKYFSCPVSDRSEGLVGRRKTDRADGRNREYAESGQKWCARQDSNLRPLAT